MRRRTDGRQMVAEAQRRHTDCTDGTRVESSPGWLSDYVRGKASAEVAGGLRRSLRSGMALRMCVPAQATRACA
jgi:hypothetical protein